MLATNRMTANLTEPLGYLAAALIALTVIGLRRRTLRRMEDVLPGAIPGAVVTWDRDELQRASDARLEEPAAGR